MLLKVKIFRYDPSTYIKRDSHFTNDFFTIQIYIYLLFNLLLYNITF